MSKRLHTAINLAFRLLGAHRVLRRAHLRQLTLTGADEDTIRSQLHRIRSLRQWQRHWTALANEHVSLAECPTCPPSQQAAHYRDAAAFFYLADIFLPPDHTDHPALTTSMVQAYHHFGRISGRFERCVISHEDIHVHGNYYHPAPGTPTPAMIMIPPLGSVKEQIEFQVAPFLNAGFACLTVDLPGVGETGGALPLDAQKILRSIITHLEQKPDILSDQIAMTGLSLGAYWTMKTAAVDPRIKLAIGISTPAISGDHWNRLPKHYWTHFQRVFKTPDPIQARRTAEQLSLFDVMDKITCPVLLFHGMRDRVSQPNALQLFLTETINAPLTTKVYPKSSHCCLDRLTDDVLPFALQWALTQLGRSQ